MPGTVLKSAKVSSWPGGATTKSYLEECDTILTEYDKLVEKRGAERAEQLMRLLLNHYTRLVLIDTGRHDLAPYRDQVAEFAARFDMTVEEVPGTTTLLDALVGAGWGDDFVGAPPGHELTFADFRTVPGTTGSNEPGE